MKFRKRLLSFVTSVVLVCGMTGNAFAATGTAKTAAPIPAITLTADQSSVQVGDTVTISMTVDGSKNGFAVMNAKLDFDSNAFAPVQATAITQAQGYSVTAPVKKGTIFTNLLLESNSNINADLGSVVTYTFTAAKAGTYDFTVSGDVSAVGYVKSTISKASKISVAVSAKTLTAVVNKGVKLTGTYGDSWEALAKQIDSSKVQLSESVEGTWAYAGTDARPTVTDKPADFIFTPEDAATYSTATASFALNIAPKELTPVLNLSDKMYDGSNAVTESQNASISLEGVLDKDDVSTEYKEISYDSADAGKHTATASGITLQGDASGNYILSANSCQTESSITPYTGKVTVQKNIASRSYDGESHPLTNEELTLTDDENGKKLTLDTDYTVSYSEEPIGSQENDVSITYTLSGKGNYEGCTFTEDTGSFTILKRPMPNASGSLNDASFTIGEEEYKPQEPGISVTGKDGEAVAGNISLRYKAENSGWTADVPSQPGEYSIGAYFESADAAYSSGMLENVTAATLTVYKTLSQEDFTLDKTEFTYNGEQQQPAVSSALSAETDYTVSAPESVNAGTYEIKITGKGYYKGEVQFGYTIAKAAGSGSVTMASYAFGETAPAPVAESKTNGTANVNYSYTGREGTEYESQEAPTAVGKYTVTAVFAATENAGECSASADFEVKAKGIVAGDFTMDKTEFAYNGSQQQPEVNAAGLNAESDYTVSYPESVNAGTYKVTVTGKGNYTGTVELEYTIMPIAYTLPQGAAISTELSEYPLSIYGGRALRLIGLKASGLPEGAQFGWKDGAALLSANTGTTSYDVTVKPNDANYTEGTVSVSVKTVNTVTPAQNDKGEVTADTVSGQLSTYLTAVNKTTAEKTELNSNVAADLAKLTLNSALTPKQQDDLKSAHMTDTALLQALDEAADVTVHTKYEANNKNTLVGLQIPAGGEAAAAISTGSVTYTAKDITPDKPASGQLIEVELTMSGDVSGQIATPIVAELTFKAKDADKNGKFQVIHKHTEEDPSKNFSTISDCLSVSKTGDEVTVRFIAASLSSFSIQYTAPASSGSGSSSATPAPEEPQPTATPAPSVSESTWLSGYGAMLNAKSGSTLQLDVSACEYLPGYIITGVQNTGVTLQLTTPVGKLVLTPAAAKAMNGSYNYTFADAMAIAAKTAAASTPAATPAPVKDPTATAAPAPTAAPAVTPAPEATPQPTQQPEQEPTAEKSHSVLPIVAAIAAVALLLVGGYLAYNSASRKKAMREVYAPTQKAHSNGKRKPKH